MSQRIFKDLKFIKEGPFVNHKRMICKDNIFLTYSVYGNMIGWDGEVDEQVAIHFIEKDMIELGYKPL